MKDTNTDTMEMTNDQQPATKDYLADLIRRFENRMIERWNDMDRKMMRWNAGPEDLPTIEDRATNDAEKQERDEEGDGDEIGEAFTTSPIKDAAFKVQGEAGRKLKVAKADKTAIDEAVKKLLEKGEFNVSNGKYGVQEMNQSKDKPSTVLIPIDTEILDKGGGGKDSP